MEWWLWYAVPFIPAALAAVVVLTRSSERRPPAGGMSRDERDRMIRTQGYGGLLMLELAEQAKRDGLSSK